MKYLFVGDLHGKLDVATTVLDNFPEYTKVFIGDYVDSFDNNIAEQTQLLRLLLEASEREDVFCLLGNHELSYLKPGMLCSGWKTGMKVVMSGLADEIRSKFKHYFYTVDGVLATHAGATGRLFDSADEVRECLEADDPCLYDIGRFRGGRAKVGGVFWCDFWEEYEPIEGLTQVSGHSAHRPSPEQRGIQYKPGCYNIDCLDHRKEVLTYDSEMKEFNTINLDE